MNASRRVDPIFFLSVRGWVPSPLFLEANSFKQYLRAGEGEAWCLVLLLQVLLDKSPHLRGRLAAGSMLTETLSERKETKYSKRN